MRAVGLFWLLRTSFLGEGVKAVRSSEAYLADLRANRYAQAYALLCPNPNVGSPQAFVARMSSRYGAGAGVTGYDLGATFTKETLDLTSAVGTVRFADGRRESVLYELRRVDSNDPGCLVTYDGFSTL